MSSARRSGCRLAIVLAIAAASAGAEMVVPSESCRGLWIVPLSTGEGPEATLELVLDTGAEPTSIDVEALARVTGLAVTAGKQYTLDTVTIGPLGLERLRVSAHELDHISTALGRPVDGILGFPAFRDVLLTLDYPRGEVRVARGSLPRRADGATIFRDSGADRPMLKVEIGGRRHKVLIDSGSTGGFDLAPDERLDWIEPPRPVNASVRFDRVDIDEAGRMAGALDFGPAVFLEPIVERAEGTSLAGYEVLRHFIWTFDQRVRKIRIEGGGEAPVRMPPRRGLGALLALDADGFEVVRVLPGSAAESAGLRVGDVVTHHDGRTLERRGCTAFGGDPDGSGAVLTVRRGAASLEIEVAPGILVP